MASLKRLTLQRPSSGWIRSAVAFSLYMEYHLPFPLQYYRRQALRLCMKHLRECDYKDAYLSLCKQSRVELEHPLLSQLHSDLVGHGDFVAAERIMQHAAQGTLCLCLVKFILSSCTCFRWTSGQLCKSTAYPSQVDVHHTYLRY